MYYMHKLLYDKTLSLIIVGDYIKWTIAFNAAIVVVVSFWFTKNGALSVLSQAIDGKNKKPKITVKHGD